MLLEGGKVKLSEMNTDFTKLSMNPIDGPKLKHALNEIPNWKRYNDEESFKLTRTFYFADFKTAFLFATKVSAISEQQNHHPVLLIGWGKVVVNWWSHNLKDLHLNDFIMAAKTDCLID
jgi:4a-hydroxytetrahydrobiopterin dehydratase